MRFCLFVCFCTTQQYVHDSYTPSHEDKNIFLGQDKFSIGHIIFERDIDWFWID